MDTISLDLGNRYSPEGMVRKPSWLTQFLSPASGQRYYAQQQGMAERNDALRRMQEQYRLQEAGRANELGLMDKYRANELSLMDKYRTNELGLMHGNRLAEMDADTKSKLDYLRQSHPLISQLEIALLNARTQAEKEMLAQRLADAKERLPLETAEQLKIIDAQNRGAINRDITLSPYRVAESLAPIYAGGDVQRRNAYEGQPYNQQRKFISEYPNSPITAALQADWNQQALNAKLSGTKAETALNSPDYVKRSLFAPLEGLETETGLRRQQVFESLINQGLGQQKLQLGEESRNLPYVGIPGTGMLFKRDTGQLGGLINMPERMGTHPTGGMFFEKGGQDVRFFDPTTNTPPPSVGDPEAQRRQQIKDEVNKVQGKGQSSTGVSPFGLMGGGVSASPMAKQMALDQLNRRFLQNPWLGRPNYQLT